MTNVDLVRLAGSRARLSESRGVDPVTAEVVRGGMETVCFEMAEYVSRTATTPILNQSNERNATVLDASGRLAALSVGIPQFMLTSTLPVRFALEFLGVDEFREGDVFVANDPYHGGGHLPDYNVFAPCFADDPASVHSSAWYTAGQNNRGLAVYYDLHDAPNVTGTMPGSPTMIQRIAPKRHVNGSNAVFLDGHARIIKAADLTSIPRWDDGDYRPNGMP